MIDNNICNICGSQDYSCYLRFKDKGKQIVMCRDCRTFRTLPYFMMDYSGQEFYCEHYLKNEELFRGFASSLLEIVARHKQGGRLLDIGCSIGLILDEGSGLGFQTEGIELNEKAVDVACSRGLCVKKCSLDGAGYDENIFDVITLNHILEHIIEPNTFMRNIKRILKDNGILTIGVPNHDSLVARLYRTRWYGWAVPEHTWHFDKKSLADLLHKNGFKIKDMIQNSQHYPFSKSLRKNTMAIIARIGNKVGAGDQLIVIAERVRS